MLLLSSLTMVLALAALEKNDRKWTGRWLLATAVLGAHFVGNQVYEFYTFASTTGSRCARICSAPPSSCSPASTAPTSPGA